MLQEMLEDLVVVVEPTVVQGGTGSGVLYPGSGSLVSPDAGWGGDGGTGGPSGSSPGGSGGGGGAGGDLTIPE